MRNEVTVAVVVMFCAGILSGFSLGLSGCSLLNDPSTNSVPPVVVTPAEPVGQYVSQWALDPVDGSKEQDKGDEIVGFIGSADYRFLANDSQGHGYFMSDVVKRASAFSWKKDGSSWIVSAKDFTSDKSGLKYKWVGFRLQKSSSAMLAANPLTVPEGDMKATFRSYWQTVK